jgi:hypothetical protein
MIVAMHRAAAGTRRADASNRLPYDDTSPHTQPSDAMTSITTS